MKRSYTILDHYYGLEAAATTQWPPRNTGLSSLGRLITSLPFFGSCLLSALSRSQRSVMKSCLKFLGKISRRLDIVLSAIKSLQSGTLFHLQSVGRLLLLPSNPHFIFPLTARVVGGTTDDFATSFLHSSLFPTALWDLANSRPCLAVT